MNLFNMEQLSTLLEQLALKLGTTVEYLWDVLIKQAFIAGIQAILAFVLVNIFIGIWYMIHRKFSNTPNKYYAAYNEVPYVAPMAFTIVILIACWIVGLVEAIKSITNFINPEYWALQQILESL